MSVHQIEVSAGGEASAVTSLSLLLDDLVEGLDADEKQLGAVMLTMTRAEHRQLRFLVNEISVRALRLEAALEGGQ